MEGFILTEDGIYKRTLDEIEKIRTEFDRQSFKQMLEQEKGKVCVCCGGTLAVEYPTYY